MLYLFSLAAALTVGPMAPRMLQRSTVPAMQSPNEGQNFDNDMSGWKPPSGGGGGHAMGGDASKFEGTDTPDFLPDEGSEAAALASGISYTDGMPVSYTHLTLPTKA